MYDMLALYEAKDVQDAVRLRLEHPEAQIIAGGRDYEVTVDFDRFGTKKMFASFAKLKKV